MMKKCNGCGIEKEDFKFPKQITNGKTTLGDWCKKCENKFLEDIEKRN